jgi:UDP-N-acetylglucosamine diphosphorylase / glucose-1-phosphate thymidylyltransferase / UDP-N-acetylgalactosamine diphosphorylase / glucosamine-1-phosphate N-acetyltransferase / galactosamine-1-phosphate N-acetyltransferase
MQVVILAAGKEKKMGKLTAATTKSMLKIKGKPILEHKINALPKKIKEVILVVGYHNMHIISHFKHCFGGRRMIYIFQNNLNGTGGALHLAKSILKDKFLVIMGDDLYHKKDLAEMLEHDLAIMGHAATDSSQFGMIKDDGRGFMLEVIEKPKNSRHKLANTGVYMLNRNFFDYDLVSIGKGEFGLPQTLASMAKDHKIKIHKARAWHSIGNAEDLKKAEELIHIFL